MSIPMKKLQYLEFSGFSTQNSGRLLLEKGEKHGILEKSP